MSPKNLGRGKRYGCFAAIAFMVFFIGMWVAAGLIMDLDPSFDEAEIHDGRPCTATVLSATDARSSVNSKRVYELKLEVKPADGTEYEATVRNALNSFEAGRAGADTEFRCVIHRTDPSRIHVFWSELKPN